MAIEIKSSLLNDEDLKHVKNSLINVSEIDNKDKFRVKTVEYINDSSYNNDDMFFYDMIEFIRFLKPGDDAVAYTTPDKEIFLNCPGKEIGEKVRIWEFVYDHECLHQLWDTFAVGEKIEKEKGSYNHEILNIASDCVINDYLDYYRKKERPPFGIFPDVIKKDFGIDYDRKKDTQYSLYLKLIEVEDKIKKSKMFKDMQDQMKQEQQGQGQGQSQDQNGSGSGSNSGSDSSSQSNSKGSSNSSSNSEANTAKDAQQQAKEAQEAANKAKEKAKQASKNGDKDADKKKEAAKKAQEAADKAKEAAKKAQEAADNKDKEGEKKAAQEAKDAADEAKKAAGEENKEGKESQNSKEGEDKGKGKPGTGHKEAIESQADLKEIKERAKDIIDKYRNKISGSFGEFIEKCKSSKDLKSNGLEINTRSGSTGWNQKMNSYVNAFVKKKVYQKKREFQSTYSRIKRGSGYVEYGKPLNPGKKVREEKLTINAAFYIDRSGSMGHCIKEVFKACYTISEALKKKFKKEQVVDKVEFKVYAFDDYMTEIKYGNQCNAGGGTMSFDRILDFIDKNTEDFLINIIITDAEFNINENEVDKLMKNIKGMLLFITNNENPTMKKIAKKYETQLFYVLADPNFEIK